MKELLMTLIEQQVMLTRQLRKHAELMDKYTDALGLVLGKVNLLETRVGKLEAKLDVNKFNRAIDLYNESKVPASQITDTQRMELFHKMFD